MKIFKNIIFDFGGVILDINYRKPEEEFIKLGIENFHDLYSKARQSHLFDEFELGLVTPEEFRNQIRTLAEKPLTNGQIDSAWNSILIDLPEQHVKLLEELKLNYRLFLLSNTNAIHEAAFKKMIIKKYGSYIIENLFEKIYLSHHIHLRKPGQEIFQYVMRDSKLIASGTLFVDDSPQHVEGAKKAGLNALLIGGDPKEFESIASTIELLPWLKQ